MPRELLGSNIRGSSVTTTTTLIAETKSAVMKLRVNGHPPSNSQAKPNGTPNGGQKRPRHEYFHSEDEAAEPAGASEGPSPKKRKINGINGLKHVNGGGPSKDDIMKHRIQLPIWTGKVGLVREIMNNDTVVILGETGSGKTTQVPQFLLEEGFANKGIIGITQPRRVAAISLATRVALEQSTRVGEKVGYSVRFDEKSSAATRIKYSTDGMMVRELLLDPLLSKYEVVIVDEAHERTLRTDMLLGSLKRIQRERNGGKRKGKAMPLKVVVMSATLDAEKFSKFFNDCPIVYIKGRQFPVKIHHSRVSQEDFNESALKTFYQIHLGQPPGDVLIFLPGQDDIENMERSIKLYTPQLPPTASKVLVLPIYRALPQEQQQRIFQPAPSGTRKCILATNIAETSITIPGIKYVIDTGMHKEKIYHSHPGGGNGVSQLLTKPISKSSAMQRAGRAGREGPGWCFRLYTENAHKTLASATTPEIRRCDMDAACLALKCSGEDPLKFDFLDPPPLENVGSALITLLALEALDNTGAITPLGRKLAAQPLDPPLARVLLASKDRGCTSEIIDILAVMTASAKLFSNSVEARDDAVAARKKFQHRAGDHMTYLNVFRSYEEMAQTSNRRAQREWCKAHYLNDKALLEARTIRNQLQENCRRERIDWKVSCGDDADPVLRCLVDGLFLKCAIKQPDGITYHQLFSKVPIKIHPSSTLIDRKPPSIMFDELTHTTALYALNVSAIQHSWLIETRFHTPDAGRKS